jgi:hypothetical protein
MYSILNNYIKEVQYNLNISAEQYEVRQLLKIKAIYFCIKESIFEDKNTQL